jgi:hypothetical protein
MRVPRQHVLMAPHAAQWLLLVWGAACMAQKPQPRFGHAMVYDEGRGVVVLVGGECTPNCSAPLDDVWEFDGAQWNKAEDDGARPPARFNHSLAYDRARTRVVLHGGMSFSELTPTTWEYDGTRWFNTGVSSPAPTASVAMAYDSVHARVLAVENASVLSWDGVAWTPQPSATCDASGETPNGRYVASFNEADGLLVVQGDSSFGSRSVSWTWDGLCWTRWAHPDGPQSGFMRQAMVYASNRSQLWLLDSSAAVIWTWSGLDWSGVLPETRPIPRSDFAAAFHAGLGELVLFGGQRTENETQRSMGDVWLWNGERWALMGP